MNTFISICTLTTVLALGLEGSVKKGPFNPEKWPASIDISKTVHYISVDNSFPSPDPKWIPNLKILTGGDHQTEPAEAGGHKAVRVAIFKFNTADDQFAVWANEHTVDILLQVYGDEALFNADKTPRYFNFLTGTLPEPIAVDGGSIPIEALNHKWNWILFRIPNGLRHMDGGRLIGTIHPKARANPEIAGVSVLSGQNGGTIRIDGLPNMKVRFVGFGQQGAFGEPEQINRYKK